MQEFWNQPGVGMHMYISAGKNQLCLSVVPKQSWPSVHGPHINPPQPGENTAEESPELSWQMGGMLQKGGGDGRDKYTEHDTEAGAHQQGRCCWVAAQESVGWGSCRSQAEH